MALTASGTTTQSALTTNTSLSHSPTILRGDLFIMQMHRGVEGSTVTAPAGWVAIENTGSLPEAGADGQIFYKEMTAVDSTPITFSWTTGSSYASVMTRYTSNIRGNIVKMVQYSVGSTATDNLASYTTPTITARASNRLCWGIGSEGAAAITYSSSDTEVAEIGNTEVSPERVAMYTTTADTAGSVSKTITPSIANQFHGLYFIAEVREIPANLYLARGEQMPNVHRAGRW